MSDLESEPDELPSEPDPALVDWEERDDDSGD